MVKDLNRRPTVLVVDDDAYGLAFFRTSLQKLQYRVETAASVSAAQRIVETGGISAIDCVLTDFRMPVQDGLELLAWLRQRDSSLATIIVTADGERSIVRDSLRGGASDFLEKPVSYRTLQEVIPRAIERTLQGRKLMEGDRGLEQAGRLDRLFMVTGGGLLRERLDYHYQPKHQVGGDFFNLIPVAPGRYVLVSGDVSGHDVQAAYVSAYFQGMLRGLLADGGVSAEGSLLQFNDLLEREWKASMSEEAHEALAVGLSLAVVAAEVDETEQALRLVNCGSPPAVLLDKHGFAERSAPGNPPLGWLPTEDFLLERRNLKPLAAIVLFSDGVVELAEKLAIDPLAIIYRIFQSPKAERARCLEGADDDVLALKFSLKAEAETMEDFQPVIHEQYAGSEHAEIDRLQSIWRRSLVFALGDVVEDRLYELLLCCREAVLNALVHGCDGSLEKIATFQVGYDRARQVVRVRVDDPGRGHAFDLKGRLAQMGDLDGKHMGLSLIHDISDRFLTENQGSSVVFDFYLGESQA